MSPLDPAALDWRFRRECVRCGDEAAWNGGHVFTTYSGKWPARFRKEGAPVFTPGSG